MRPHLLPPQWTWAQRRARAAELQGACPEAAEVLSLYGEVAGVQELLGRHAAGVTGILRAHRKRQGVVPASLPLHRFQILLYAVERRGPQPLASAAARLRSLGTEAQEAAVRRFLGEAASESDPAEEVLAWLFLQPLAEAESRQLLAEPGSLDEEPGHEDGPGAACPLCAAPPLLGYLVSREGEAGALYLLCSLCGTSWRHARTTCPWCGRTDSMSVYRQDQRPHLRVDVCDRCSGYLKVLDLRADGRAVPPADDLASLTLDLWAQERGYRKACVNLAGL